MKTKTFEDFLKEKHAEQYTGLDDEMIDNCGDWFYNEIRRQDIVKYADEYASQQKQEMVEKIDKLKIDGKKWLFQHEGLVESQNKKIEALKQNLTK